MKLLSALTTFALAFTVSCGGGGGSSSAPPPPAGPPANTVWVGGGGTYPTTAFNPPILTVPANTAVSFVWQGGTHTVSSYTLSSSPTFPGVPSPGQSSGTYTYTFTTPGTYYYYCTYHGNFFGTFPNATQEATGMAGKVVVQ